MPNVTPPPVPTRERMADAQTGVATRPWVSWFTTLGQIFGYNQTIQAGGTPQPQELAINFLAPIVVTDNPVNGSTDVSLPAPAYSVQFGTTEANATGNDYSSVDVLFPTAFSSTPKVFVNSASFPRGSNAPMSCYATNITADGFTANLACSVPTGGGGATIDNQIQIDWLAING